MDKNYKDCLFNDKTILKSQPRFKGDCHNVYAEQINKIALSSNDDKRLQTFDKIKLSHTEQTHSKYAKVSFEEKVKNKLLILMIILMKIRQKKIEIGHIS